VPVVRRESVRILLQLIFKNSQTLPRGGSVDSVVLDTRGGIGDILGRGRKGIDKLKREKRSEIQSSGGQRGGRKMSALARLAGSVVMVSLVSVGCGGPMLVFPGGALSGEVVTEEVTDWSFASDAFVAVETRPEDPYSVDLNYIVRDGKLYLDPAEGRRWFEFLKADPNVRVRFDGKVYPVTAVLVGKPGELEGFDPERFVYRLESRTE
jgi:hypothetical protein